MWWVRVRFLPPLVVAATVLAGFGLGHCPGCCGALAVPAAGRDSGQRDHIGSLPSSRAVPASAGTDRIVVTAVAAAGPQEGWSQFASQVIFPGAGCYRIRATWARASWTLTVGVGL